MLQNAGDRGDGAFFIQLHIVGPSLALHRTLIVDTETAAQESVTTGGSAFG